MFRETNIREISNSKISIIFKSQNIILQYVIPNVNVLKTFITVHYYFPIIFISISNLLNCRWIRITGTVRVMSLTNILHLSKPFWSKIILKLWWPLPPTIFLSQIQKEQLQSEDLWKKQTRGSYFSRFTSYPTFFFFFFFSGIWRKKESYLWKSSIHHCPLFTNSMHTIILVFECFAFPFNK